MYVDTVTNDELLTAYVDMIIKLRLENLDKEDIAAKLDFSPHVYGKDQLELYATAMGQYFMRVFCTGTQTFEFVRECHRNNIRLLLKGGDAVKKDKYIKAYNLSLDNGDLRIFDEQNKVSKLTDL